MYVSPNFKTKKALREALKKGEEVRIFSPGPFGTRQHGWEGSEYVEGPHYPQPHTWYAKVHVKDNVVLKVLS